MVSPIVFMIPPPAPWLSMAQLRAELRKAIESDPEQAASPSPERQPADTSPHKVDLVA